MAIRPNESARECDRVCAAMSLPEHALAERAPGLPLRLPDVEIGARHWGAELTRVSTFSRRERRTASWDREACCVGKTMRACGRRPWGRTALGVLGRGMGIDEREWSPNVSNQRGGFGARHGRGER